MLIRLETEELGRGCDHIGVRTRGGRDVRVCAPGIWGGLQGKGGVGPRENRFVADALQLEGDRIGRTGCARDGAEGEADFEIVYEHGRADVAVLAEIVRDN